MAARVPYDAIPRVDPQGLPGVRMSPSAPEGAFGGGQASAEVFGQARGLAQDIARQQEEVRQKADLAAVFKATADLSNYTNDVQYNPQTGIVAQKGENAFNLAKSVPEDYRKKVSALMGSLTSPEQKEIFQRHADQNWNQLNGFNQRHIAGQSEHYMAQQADAYVAARQNAASLAGASGDLKAVEAAANDVDQARRAWALKNGISKDAADQIILQDKGKAYVGAITAMVNAKNYSGAKDALAAAGDGIPQKERDHLTRLLKQESDLGKAYDLADVALSYDPETLQGALNHIDKIVEQDKIDPEIRKAAHNLASERFGVMKAAKAQEYLADVDQAEKIIEQTADLRAIPVELRDKLHRKDISNLATRAAQIKRGEEPVTDWKTYSSLKDMAADPAQRKDFLAIAPSAYRGKLSDTEFKELVSIRSGLLKGDEGSKKKIDGYRTIRDIITSTLDLNGFKERDEPEEREKIERVMDEEVKYFRSTHDGKDPSNDEVQKMITKLTTEHVIEERSILPNKKEMGYQTTQRYLEKADGEIPAETRTKIEERLRAANVEPTRRRILEVYLEMKSMEPYQRFLPK